MSTGSQDKARALLVKNPQMAASSFYNQLVTERILVDDSTTQKENQEQAVASQAPHPQRWYEAKSAYRPFAGKKARETDSVTSTGPSYLVAAGTKVAQLSKAFRHKVATKEAQKHTRLRCQFLESDTVYRPDEEIVGPSKFKVVLIEEGLGNLRDLYYYTKDALQSCVPLFNGAKIYANHPSVSEEQDRPERSVKDLLGHFENVTYAESDDGRGRLEGECYTMPDEDFRWARALMREAVQYKDKYPDRNFIGLSINAGGDAEVIAIDKLLPQVPLSTQTKLLQAKTAGSDSVRLVKKIESVVSCDLVTEPGAGGRVLEILNAKRG